MGLHAAETFRSEDETTDHARGVGRALAFEVGYSHTVDQRTLETVRGYATLAGDSLGKDVRSCLRYGNAAAAAFDAKILELAIVAIVTTFGDWAHLERARMQMVEANRGVRRVRSVRGRQAGWTSRFERKVWSGYLA